MTTSDHLCANDKSDILFVDDEPQVLSGLRGRLRRDRKRWNLRFVESGEQALLALKDREADVLVTDMQMPGMHGFDLLRHVRDRHPRCVRVVLSGEPGTKKRAGTANLYQRWHTKPCDLTDLRVTLKEACQLRAVTRDRRVQGVVGDLMEIPAHPRIHAKLTELIAMPGTTTADVVKTLESDVGLAMKVMRLANSVWFRRGHDVTSLELAAQRLGFDLLCNLVLVAEVFESGVWSNMSHYDMDEAQARAAAGARLAEEICPEPELRKTAFTAALLRDVGEIVLSFAFGPAYSDALRAARNAGVASSQAELEAFGVTHARVGAYLLQLWGLPLTLCSMTVRHHDGRNPGEPFDVLGAVQLADELVTPGHLDPDDTGPFDAYLRGAGVHGELATWQGRAQELCATLSR